MFRLTQHRTIYGDNSAINRLMKNANKFKGDFLATSNDALFDIAKKSPLNLFVFLIKKYF